MPHAEVLSTDTPQLFQVAVKRATEMLRAGEVVALPTETVYGLAANALDSNAVSKIFQLKGRPAHNPIIVHISNLTLAKRCVRYWPELAERLARAFWPGPLTLVLPRADIIPDIVTAGGSTVGVRWPNHPFIQAVIQECQFPLAAPSANPASRVSPTSAAHVHKYLGDRIPLIVDGGLCPVGIESTVLDLSASPPRLLRQGMIHEQTLLALTGELLSGSNNSETILKSPGQLTRHYSPKAKLLVAVWTNDEELEEQILVQHASPVKTSVIAHTQIPFKLELFRVAVVPHEPEAFAGALYAELHECDQPDVELIVVEQVPQTTEWTAIRDRLKRAAAMPDLSNI